MIGKIRRALWRFWLRLCGKAGRGSYYIGGTDVLPHPLSREEESRALAQLEQNDPEAKDLLIEHNLRLVVYVAKRYESTGIGIEDLISIGTVGLIKAIGTFRPDKNIRLATYASRCIENEILMYIRKRSSQRGEISLDEPLSMDWDGNELLLSDILGDEEGDVGRELERREEERVLREAVASLDERERLLIEMRFGMYGRPEMTQKEVADTMGISQSYISRLEKKVIRRLRSMIEGKI